MKERKDLQRMSAAMMKMRSPFKAVDPEKKVFTVANASLEQLKKWKKNPKATSTMSSGEISAMNARIQELTAKKGN